MELFGIGPMELLFIILLAIIIFGPKDIVNASKTVGKSLNKFIRSDTWKTINQTTRELQNLPTRLMRESGLDELEQSTRQQVARVNRSIQGSLEPDSSPDTPMLEPPTTIPTPDGQASIKPPEQGPVG
jgi:Sec-independent protein translocase protein TatA